MLLHHGTQGRGRTPRGELGGAPPEAGSWAFWPSAPPKSSVSPASFYRTGRATTPTGMMQTKITSYNQ